MKKLNIQLFAEEELTPEQKALKEAAEMQLAQLNEMKAKMDKMIDPEQYQALKKEYDTLLNDYVNKRPAAKVEKTPTKTIPEMAKSLASYTTDNTDSFTDLDFIKESLGYRNAVLEETGLDVFTHDGIPSEDSQQVAEALQSIVDEAKTPEHVHYLLDQIMVDDKTFVSALNKQKTQKRN